MSKTTLMKGEKVLPHFGPTPGKKKGPKTSEQTVLFEKVATEVLHDDRELFNVLKPTEQRLVLDWFADAIVEGEPKNAIHDVLWEVDYHQKPVGIETFISDPYYLGGVLEGGATDEGLHENWVHDLCVVFAPGSQIAEWIMTGAIGVGKTTVASAAMAYKLYCLSCLRNPAKYYGLLADSLIVFGIYSITKRQVADTGYFNVRGYLDTSPYFRTDFRRSPKIDSKCDFEPTTGKKIQIVPGSMELHALGLNLFSFMMDEVNFMRAKRDKDSLRMTGQAYSLYAATYARILSRFMRPGGLIPGIMLLMSSRNAQTSFLEGHLKSVTGGMYRDGMRGQVSDHTYLSDYALWEVKPAFKYTKPKFRVEVGDKASRSRILSPKAVPRRGAKIVFIPGEFLEVFQRDVDQGLRDIAGVATYNVSPLIRDRESVYDAVRGPTWFAHPFTATVLTLSTEDDVLLEEHFDKKLSCRVQQSRWVPKLNPGLPRFIHVDTSLTGDCTGFAMAHPSGIVRTKRPYPDGSFGIVSEPFVIVDMMLRILPPPGAEIPLWKIRSFILYLSKIYPIGGVSFDGYQSRDSVQLLQKEHLKCRIQSMDITDEPYSALKSALFERRTSMYRYDPFIDEVLALEHIIRESKAKNKGKVDHPAQLPDGSKGSKDVADAVCGAVFACLIDESARVGLQVYPDDVLPMGESRHIADMGQADVVERVTQPTETIVGETVLDWKRLRQNI